MSEVDTTKPVPVVLHEGRYRLYQKPDGGLRLQYRRDDKDEDDFFELPGMMVRLLDQAQAGNMSPMQFMREAMKLRK
jgi:hypothetical protein